jgi:hypothetical protein
MSFVSQSIGRRQQYWQEAINTYLEAFPIVTSPITAAEGATKAPLSDIFGTIPSTATKRVDGTSFSVYLVISKPFPMLSKAELRIFEA